MISKPPSRNYDQGKDTVAVVCTYIRESEKAVCISIESEATGKYVSTWLPKSQFHHPSNVSTAEDGTQSMLCFIPRWLAEKGNLPHVEYDPAMIDDEPEEPEPQPLNNTDEPYEDAPF